MKNKHLIHLGENIRRFRSSKGFTQEVLAEKTGLHRTYIGGVERGERNISLLNLVKIANALETTVAEIVIGLE